MNHLVKVISDDEGYEVDNKVWHLATFGGGSPTVLCTSEVFGYGEGGAVVEEKEVKRGGITCDHCIEIIKKIKSVRL